MTTSHYQRGSAQERRLKVRLESEGYYVIKSAGSKGAADLVAIKPYQILMIQAKLNDKISVEEWNTLYETARRLRAIPVLCFRGGALWRLTGSRRPRSRLKPWEAFTTDSVASPDPVNWEPGADALPVQ